MKIFLLTIASLVFTIGSFAQEKAIAKIQYTFTHINDTTQRDKHRRDEVVTYLAQHSAYYTSYSSESLSEMVKKQQESPGFDGNIVLTKSTTTIDRHYMYFPSQQKVIEIAKFGGDTFVTDGTFEAPNWEIQDETKEIGGYHCQKATTDFKGRTYTAWFTMDLPFSHGPWKLQGLPGLILQASDSKKEVNFEYAGFDKIIGDGEIVIEVPSSAIRSTALEVKKLERAFKSNPQAYLQSKAAAPKGAISVGNSSGIVVRGKQNIAGSSSSMSNVKSINVKNDSAYKPSQITNNPIELIP